MGALEFIKDNADIVFIAGIAIAFIISVLDIAITIRNRKK